MRFARTHSKTWQPMIDIWARTAGNLYLNKNMKIIMLVHRFICFPLQTYCDYLSLSLCSFQIWFELVTPPVTQRGEGKQGQWEKRQVLIGLAVVCWGGFSRQGFPLRLGRKKQTKMLRSQAHSLQKQVIFLSFLFLLTVLENSCVKLNGNVLHSVFNSCDFLIYCFIVTLKYAESHEQELIERVK